MKRRILALLMAGAVGVCAPSSYAQEAPEQETENADAGAAVEAAAPAEHAEDAGAPAEHAEDASEHAADASESAEHGEDAGAANEHPAGAEGEHHGATPAAAASSEGDGEGDDEEEHAALPAEDPNGEDAEPAEEHNADDLPEEGVDPHAEARGDANGGADDAPEESGNVPHAGRLNRGQYLQALRRVLTLVEERVLARMRTQIERKGLQGLWRVAKLALAVPLLGLLLFLAPVLLGKRFPGKGKTLWRTSALAAGLAVGTGYLFAGLLLLMRYMQLQASFRTNPQLAITHGAFEALRDNIEKLYRIGPRLLEPTLQQLTSMRSEGNLSLLLLENAQRFRRDVDVFLSIGRFFRSISGVLAALPNILAVVAVGLFFWAVRPVFADIARLPQRAAEGSDGVVNSVLRDTMRRLTLELKVTLCQIAALFSVTLLVGVLLNLTVAPAIEGFLTEVLATFLYVQSVRDVSPLMVRVALVATLLFLVLNVALSVLTTTFFLGKTQKIFRERFMDGVPLRAHARFWKWGVPSVLWAMLLPLLYVWAANKGIDVGVERLHGHVPPWPSALLYIPVGLLLGWFFVFWAARGFKALGFLARYKREEAPAPAPAPTPAV